MSKPLFSFEQYAYATRLLVRVRELRLSPDDLRKMAGRVDLLGAEYLSEINGRERLLKLCPELAGADPGQRLVAEKLSAAFWAMDTFVRYYGRHWRPPFTEGKRANANWGLNVASAHLLNLSDQLGESLAGFDDIQPDMTTPVAEEEWYDEMFGGVISTIHTAIRAMGTEAVNAACDRRPIRMWPCRLKSLDGGKTTDRATTVAEVAWMCLVLNSQFADDYRVGVVSLLHDVDRSQSFWGAVRSDRPLEPIREPVF
jgi:hypothetical protein